MQIQGSVRSSASSQLPAPYKSGNIRFLTLFLLAMVVFGNQYAFNNPQALQQSMENDLHITQTQFQLLYSIFAFPNIFATFIIGFLIDFLGVRTGLITLSAGVAIFQLVIAIGGYSYSYTTILIGRMLFGLASQSLITAQASFVSFWFKGKQLAFALGLAVTFPQLGNAFNSYLSPLIYQSTQSLGAPLLVSVGICIISLGCALLAAWIDKKADQHDLQNKIKQIQTGTDLSEAPQSQEIKCSDVKKLKGSFWLICVLCMFGVALYVPFLDNANRMFQYRFCFTQVTSGRALMVTYIVAATVSAPLGYLVDKVGFKRYFIIASMGIFTIAQILILAYPQCDYPGGLQQNGSIVGLALIGLGYCFYGNCILPAIPLVVRKKVTGTAFGIMQMIESIALSFFPIITGQLVQKAPNPQIGYRHSSLFFTIIGLAGIACSCGLLFVSDKTKQKLDKCSKEKIQVQRIPGTEGMQSNATERSESQTQKSSADQGQKSQNDLNGSLLHSNQKKGFNLQL